MSFGLSLKEARKAKNLSIRDVYVATGFSPSDYYKVENNLAPAPDTEILEILRDAFGYKIQDDLWVKVIESAQEPWVPPAPLTEEQLVGKLPALVGAAFSEEQADRLVESIKSSFTPDPNLRLKTQN